MTDSLASVVIPHARFLVCQKRRRRIVAESTRRGDPPPTIDAGVVLWPLATAR